MIGSLLGAIGAAFGALKSFMEYKKIKALAKNKKDSMKSLLLNIKRKDKVQDIERTVQDTVSEDVKKESQRIVI